jgi:hypothetical protein
MVISRFCFNAAAMKESKQGVGAYSAVMKKLSFFDDK